MPKLTKELKAGLTALAQVFPATTENFRKKVTGQQLLSEGTAHVATNKGVQPVKRAAVYGISAQRPVNHARRLCGAYANQGRAGVLDYCRPHIEPAHFAAFSAKLSELVPAS